MGGGRIILREPADLRPWTLPRRQKKKTSRTRQAAKAGAQGCLAQLQVVVDHTPCPRNMSEMRRWQTGGSRGRHRATVRPAYSGQDVCHEANRCSALPGHARQQPGSGSNQQRVRANAEEEGHSPGDQVQDRQNGGRENVLKHNDLRTDVEEAEPQRVGHVAEGLERNPTNNFISCAAPKAVLSGLFSNYIAY